MRYVLKQPHVDAVQWFKEGDHPKVKDGLIDCGFMEVFVYAGDWIVTNSKAGTGVVSNEDFNEMYVLDKKEQNNG